MDLRQIQELLKIVSESGVAEVELEEEGFRMVVRVHAPVLPTPQVPSHYALAYPPPYMGGADQPAAGSIPALVEPSEAPGTAPEVSPSAQQEVTVRAPIVGTFYRASAPESPPFVDVGAQVKPGDVLCIIEAMKLMNEIECEETGTIVNILVENGQPVEYDQPLFVVAQA